MAIQGELRERARRLWRRWLDYGPPLRHVWVAAAGAVLLAWTTWMTCGLRGCPNVETLSAYQPGGAPVLLDRSGEEFARLRPVSRELVPLDELPDHVPAAFLAVEDHRFYDHGSIDWRRVGGSVLANVRAGGFAQGFSTISMQLARNVFPGRLPAAERSPRRKLLEMRVAGEIEDHFSKDEILELYLNHIYFGGSLYGIEAAARDYFGKSARDLTLAEAATLAAMPKAPNSYHPRNQFERSRERRGLVLSLMAEQGRISGEEADRAQRSGVRVRPERAARESDPGIAPYFVRAVRRLLEDRLGDALYGRPLRIHTTLDRSAQSAAENALDRQLRAVERGAAGRFDGPRYGGSGGVEEGGTTYLQGAAVVLDPATGDVLALVGGRDYRDSPYDRATQARRQAGSAFKPFVFAAALEAGYAPSQALSDEPLRLELAGGEVWEPSNFTGRHAGEVTLREAVVTSNNVATVRLAMAVGLDEVLQEARQAGLGGRLPETPSVALGTAGVTLLEMTAAYIPFTARGRTAEPRLVTRVEEEEGRLVWSRAASHGEMLDPDVAYLVTDLLQDAVRRGTGARVRDGGFRGAAAGKTGTTNDGHDAWFVGYTPDLVGGVWVGFDRPRPIAADASGGRIAAPAWGRMMAGIYRDRPAPPAWDRPASVVERDIDPASGLVLEEGCSPVDGRARAELFLADDVPASVCPDGAGEPGLFGRLADAFETLVLQARGRLASLHGSLFGDAPDAAPDEDRDRFLGRPRLPRAGQARPAADTTPDEPPAGPLGTPVESIPDFGGPPIPDTAEPLPDTIRLPVTPDTVPPDTVPFDTVPPVTPLPDTLPRG